ncbi:MAG: sigma-70 family RNA polymerase sigma factor [Myxococcales bacterium]|nr:sigma-70 family RNA polymerase sigma factor [Myxococcales bacterium]
MSVEVEEQIRQAHAAGDLRTAATVALSAYRAEVYAFLVVRLAGEAAAYDVLSQVSEDLWRGLPGFRFECSFRTWLYALARHAALRHERLVANQPRRRRGLSSMPELPAELRSSTRPYLRTDVKDRFATLRRSLSPDEQTLLVLRVDRDLPWEDVARIMNDAALEDAAALARATATLRQRFRTLKKRLAAKARAEGLLDR